jgi:DNA-binding transcriptional LysR family regulator
MFVNLLEKGGLSLDRLQSFCEVAEAGGLTCAAKGDPTRQSQFSRQIKELEEFFGVELVRRKGRGIALTSAGEQLRMVAQEQLSALSDFKKSCGGQAIELTVAAGDTLIQWLLLPRLGGIRDRATSVAFRFLNLPTTEITSRLRDGTVDIGLVRHGSAARPLQTSSLGTLRFSLFVPSQLLPATKPKSLSDRLPIATLEGTGQFRQQLDRLSKSNKLNLNVQLELSSFPLVARALQTGEFAGILPSIALAEFGAGKIEELKLDVLRPLSREIVLAWNPRTARIRGTLEKALPVFRSLCRL